MPRIILFNKPFRLLSQFREVNGKETLAKYFRDSSLRVAGRLDYDSEGLLILSDNGKLIHRISEPRHKVPKTYWAQVEGVVEESAINSLCAGVQLKDGKSRPARAQVIAEPAKLWPRNPPIRYRASIPTSWIELTITEGRNRQVRRMTAAVGYPTLRLIRCSVGDWELGKLKSGEFLEIRN